MSHSGEADFYLPKNGPIFETNQDMDYESVRLSSYVNWPLWGAKRATELAENGLFYSGERDKVVCFSCGGEIENWTFSDNVKERHLAMYPHCAYANGQSTSNRKMTHGTDQLSPNADAEAEMSTNSTFSVANGFADVEEELSSFRNSPEMSNKTRTELIVGPQELGTGPIDEVDPHFVKYENYRLRTFIDKWPEDSYISPAALAKAGFYFFGHPDRVQCAFCRGRLLNWKPTDLPMSEHRIHFPNCPFVQGRNVGNVTIEQTSSSVQRPRTPEEGRRPPTKSEKLGVVTGRSKQPEFSTLTARMDTFKIWPKNHIMSAENLARAGFYYVGYSDNVRCFYCDGGLRNWESDDDPWREHARWFPKCGFLKLQKGEDFINTVLSNNNLTDSENLLLANAADIPKVLDTSMARTVLAMGFDQTMVARVMEEKRTATGSDFSNATDLLNALLKEEENEEREHASGSNSHTGKSKLSRRQKRNKKKLKEAKSSPRSGESSPEQDLSERALRLTEDPGMDEETINSLVEENPEVRSLVEEYQRVKEERTCKVCMDEESIVVFLPCGHLVCCANCAPALRTCPICRNLIKGTVRVYAS